MKCKPNLALITLALTAGLSTVLGQTQLYTHDFQNLNGWTASSKIQMSNPGGQLVLTHRASMPTPIDDPVATAGSAWPPGLFPPAVLPEQQTLELRVDLVGANQDDAFAYLQWWHMEAPASTGYTLLKDQDEIGLIKQWNSGAANACLFWDNASLRNENVTLVLAFTRLGTDLRITSRVLDKDNGNAVLFERIVTDTPLSDPVLPSGAVKGIRMQADPAATPWLLQDRGTVIVGVWWGNTQTAPQVPAKVSLDDLEVWQYESPQLAIQNVAIQNAVVLSWPLTQRQFVLESAASVAGRYAPVPQSPTIKDGRYEVAVPTTEQAQFFRLSQLSSQVEVLHQGPTLGGAPFRGMNGITQDAAGRLYIASVFGREIVVLDPVDGAFLERFGPAQGVLFPDDVAFGPDGSLYWTDIAVGQVGRRAPDGTVTKQFVAPGVNPITFSADGRLLVGLAFYGDALWELDPQLQEPPQLVLDAPGQLNSFSFGPDGLLYSPSNTRRTLVRIDVDAQTLTPIGALNRSISAVKFDAAQRLWLHSEGDLLRVNRDTGVIEQTIALGQRMDNFVPIGEDRFYVSGPDGLLEVTVDGTIRQIRPGGMRNPGGLAVVGDGDEEVLVVADLQSMYEFDAATGALLETHQSNFMPPPGVSTLLGPMTVSASPAGVVVSTWIFPSAGHNVQEYDLATGTVLRQVIVTNTPISAIEFQGKLVVAEIASGSVAQFDGEERTVLASGLFVPAGLAASADALYVGDWASGLIFQLVAGGVPLTPPRIVIAGLKNPEGLALDANGDLLVVETGSRSLVRVNTTTGQITTVAAGLDLGPPLPAPGFPPTYMFDGVAVGSSDAIYVTGYGANVTYRITE